MYNKLRSLVLITGFSTQIKAAPFLAPKSLLLSFWSERAMSSTAGLVIPCTGISKIYQPLDQFLLIYIYIYIYIYILSELLGPFSFYTFF